MTLQIKHKFTSAKSDGIDPSIVQPSNWNDTHSITMDPFTLIGRGSGSGDATGISMDAVGVPIGVPVMWPADPSLIPSNYLLCYGQAVSRTTYSELFAIYGTTHGAGDGSTTFNLPDMRGVTPVGKTDMGGSDRGNLSGGGVLGATLGAQNNNVSVNVTASGTPTLTGTITSGTAAAGGTSGGSQYAYQGNPVSVTGTVNVTGTGATASPVSVVQPSFVTNWIVKYTRL